MFLVVVPFMVVPFIVTFGFTGLMDGPNTSNGTEDELVQYGIGRFEDPYYSIVMFFVDISLGSFTVRAVKGLAEL